MTLFYVVDDEDRVRKASKCGEPVSSAGLLSARLIAVGNAKRMPLSFRAITLRWFVARSSISC